MKNFKFILYLGLIFMVCLVADFVQAKARGK